MRINFYKIEFCHKDTKEKCVAFFLLRAFVPWWLKICSEAEKNDL